MRGQSKPGPKKALKDPLAYGKVFLSVDQFAECIGLSRAEAYKFLKKNTIPVAKNGSRYLIPAAVVKDIQTGSFYRKPDRLSLSIPKSEWSGMDAS